MYTGLGKLMMISATASDEGLLYLATNNDHHNININNGC
jgi:hypothetical protein